MKRFTLRCESYDHVHVKFSLFDPANANCGLITIRTEDVTDFIGKGNWEGAINWNKKLPEDELVISPYCP